MTVYNPVANLVSAPLPAFPPRPANPYIGAQFKPITPLPAASGGGGGSGPVGSPIDSG